MRIGNNLHPYKTVTQRSSLAQMALNYLDYVLNKAAEISIRVFSFFSFFFVISAGFLHHEPFYYFSLQIQVSTNSKQDRLQHSLALAL